MSHPTGQGRRQPGARQPLLATRGRDRACFHNADGTNALTRLRFASRADNHHGQPIRALVMDPLSSAEMSVDPGTSRPLLPRFNGAALFRARRFLVQDPPHVGGESNRGRRHGLDVVFFSRSPMECGPEMRREITEVAYWACFDKTDRRKGGVG